MPPAQSGGGSKALPIVLGIAGLLVVGIIGIAAVIFLAGGDDGPTSATDTTTATDDAGSDGVGAGDDTDAGESTTSDFGPAGDAADDVVGCVRIDQENVELELVNNSSQVSSYFLTVAFFDDGGARLADESAFIGVVRPGERVIEQQFTFEDVGTTCEIIDTDRFEAEVGDLSEAGPCELAPEPDFFDNFEGSTSVTNSTDVTSDYTLDVTFVDGDGIRRGSGTVFAEAVRPGETAPAEIFTSTDYNPGYTCEVVRVFRSDS